MSSKRMSATLSRKYITSVCLYLHKKKKKTAKSQYNINGKYLNPRDSIYPK